MGLKMREELQLGLEFDFTASFVTEKDSKGFSLSYVEEHAVQQRFRPHKFCRVCGVCQLQNMTLLICH